MRTRLRAWMFGVMVVVLALVSGAVAQTTAKDMSEAPGILPSGFGEAVDRDIMTIRDATAKFKTRRSGLLRMWRSCRSCCVSLKPTPQRKGLL